MAGEVGFAALLQARHADEIGVGVSELQQIVGGLALHKGRIAVVAHAQVGHVGGHLFGQIPDQMAGRVRIGIDPAAGHLRLYADELALEHVELRDHRQVHIIGHDHALVRMPAVEDGVLPDGHDLLGLVVGHVVRDLPAFPQDEIGPFRRNIRVGEAAGVHKILFAGGDGRFAGDAEIVPIGAVVVEADVEMLLDGAAARLDDADGFHQGMGVPGGFHRAGLVRVPIKLHVVGGFVIGQHIAIAIRDGAPCPGLVGGDDAGGSHRRLIALRFLHGQLHKAPAQISAHGEEHQRQERQTGVQFPYRLPGHTASTCRFNKGLKSAIYPRAHSPVSNARGRAP